LAEGDVLAFQQHLHGARLKLSYARLDGRGAADLVAALRVAGKGGLVFRTHLLDEAREHRGGALPVQLGVVVLVQKVQAHHARRDARLAADLARPERTVKVQDFAGRDAGALHAVPVHGRFARMAAQEVIGDPPADRVELDPRANDVAVRQALVVRQRQHLGFEKLKLQRDA